jgi:adenylate kinase
MLAETLNLPAISTGELLRREQKTGSVLGQHVKTLMSQGKMLGVTLMDHLLRHRLAKTDAKRGFLLDGYPRKIEQLRHLLALTKTVDRLYFIVINVSDKEVLRRLSGRRVCECGASYHLIYNKPRRVRA